MDKPTVSMSYITVICRDFVALATFYRDLLGYDEIPELESDIFRALRSDGPIIGFHSPGAFDLLNLPEADLAAPGNSIWTFGTESDEAVDTMTARAVELGAVVVKEPFRTYYGAWQSVLHDPEGNIFRFSKNAN
ncbi:putative lactoylglutathione lyase [Gordonia amarae]|uniref:VOC domain-containing protein n=2 Tax=Gordonia amarae TaxID=36821 RepID=G7GKV4_9ACTN|nr:VOC family protein [Gordonia amarae]MCS3876799.1 putative lactoylglutathione lyase [Gordonia amarae]GAB04229.1 hypothetical protein GOAMR_15_00110 [Gordonia amarae NBRC 15530]